MDYDKINFQSQNVQLAADNNKSPQSLPLLSLPKFDFDSQIETLYLEYKTKTLGLKTSLLEIVL